ncbi:hypothetical protein TNCV_2339901 [Trichonephila clavipes]|nr:hypothetical protein TNCV_2339901 [Trichonephila clavipes]
MGGSLNNRRIASPLGKLVEGEVRSGRKRDKIKNRGGEAASATCSIEFRRGACQDARFAARTQQRVPRAVDQAIKLFSSNPKTIATFSRFFSALKTLNGEKKLSRPSVRLASLEEFQDEVAQVKRPESFFPCSPSTFPSWGFSVRGASRGFNLRSSVHASLMNCLAGEDIKQFKTRGKTFFRPFLWVMKTWSLVPCVISKVDFNYTKFTDSHECNPLCTS